MNNTWATFSFQISCSLQNSTDFLNICKKTQGCLSLQKNLPYDIVCLFISLDIMWVVTEEIHAKGLIGSWGSFFLEKKTKQNKTKQATNYNFQIKKEHFYHLPFQPVHNYQDPSIFSLETSTQGCTYNNSNKKIVCPNSWLITLKIPRNTSS